MKKHVSGAPDTRPFAFFPKVGNLRSPSSNSPSQFFFWKSQIFLGRKIEDFFEGWRDEKGGTNLIWFATNFMNSSKWNFVIKKIKPCNSATYTEIVPVTVGWIPRNFKIFIFSLNCHFWGKITNMITGMNFRIFTKSPYINSAHFLKITISVIGLHSCW